MNTITLSANLNAFRQPLPDEIELASCRVETYNGLTQVRVSMSFQQMEELVERLSFRMYAHKALLKLRVGMVDIDAEIDQLYKDWKKLKRGKRR